MVKLYNLLFSVSMLMWLVSACSAQIVQAQPEKPPTVQSTYESVLGKLQSDQEVQDFIVKHHCSASGSFELCQEFGIALWVDAQQQLKTIYLYSGNADGFQRYRGKLPYGLTFYDPMWLVEEKLSALDKDSQSQKIKQPDETSSPDHIHYWATYKQLGLVVVYDTGIADPDAYIYAVLVSK